MEMEENTGTYITTIDGRVIRITEFLSFGFDTTFMAAVGRDLYIRGSNNLYRLCANSDDMAKTARSYKRQNRRAQ